MRAAGAARSLFIFLAGCTVITSDFVFEDAEVVDAGADGGVMCATREDCAPVASAAVDCAAGVCVITGCVGSALDCDQRYETGCEVDSATRRDHCGGCGRVCDLPGAEEVCEAGSCRFVACEASRADCDSDVGNGCEADLSRPTSCGGCEPCGEATPACAREGDSFSCVVSCGAQSDCAGSCVDLQSSASNCGMCDRACDDPPFAAPLCVAGVCSFACDAGRGNCNDDEDGSLDGCETDTNFSVDHCGGCDQPCLGMDATWACSEGSCDVVACESGFGDCNNTASDGCERDLLSDAMHCGGCDQVCEGPCEGGVCDPVVDVDLGLRAGCAVRASGATLCWGFNGRGALGNGSFRSGTAQTVLREGEPAEALEAERIAVAEAHACALVGGRPYCWGTSTQGESGVAGPILFEAHAVVGSAVFMARTMSEISAYTRATCSVDTVGDVWCWGQNSVGVLGAAGGPAPVQVEEVSGATDVGVGNTHACALQRDGEVRCWGRNTAGQLGRGTLSAQERAAPVLLPDDARSLAVGASHSCAVLVDGRLFCWGSNTSFRLGTEMGTEASTPVEVRADVGAVAAGANHTCAVVGGVPSCWGFDDVGQLGDGTSTAAPRAEGVAISGLTRADALAAHGNGTCAIDSGRVRCWGASFLGPLGESADIARLSPIDVALSAADARAVTSSANPTTRALLSDGTRPHGCAVYGGELYCWGNAQAAQTGRGVANASAEAVLVTVPGGLSVSAVDSSRDGVMFIAGGQAYGLGDNRYNGASRGDLGLGSLGLVQAPTVLPLAGEEDELGMGDEFGCVRQGGNVYCFGSDESRQLGRGTAGDSDVPVLVEGLSDAVQLAVGRGRDDLGGETGFVCVRRETGAVACWGNNSRGQRGDGDSLSRPTPTDVAGIRDAIDVSAGTMHACAIVEGATVGQGSVFCWGDNRSGQLGATASADPLSPRRVPGADDYVEVAAYDRHSCARRVSGEVQCWGDNTNGQLGDGTGVSSFRPVVVMGVDAIALGSGNGAASTCAVESDGVVCWGGCWDGACGSGRALRFATPQEVVGLP